MICYEMKVINENLIDKSSHSVVSIEGLGVGDPLSFNIYIKKDENSTIIVEAGEILSDTIYKILKKQKIAYIANNDQKNQEILCHSLKKYIFDNVNDIEKTLDFLYTINNEVFTNFYQDEDDIIDVKCLELIVRGIIHLLENNQHYVKDVIPFFLNRDEIAAHSIHVTIYALRIGQLLKLKENNLMQLGIAAMLHDSGHKKIDKSILNKESVLSVEELNQIKKHPKYSANIAKHNYITDPYIIDAITHHHEHYDGSGYPYQLKEEEIGEFASIIGVCDVFDALTNDRPTRKKFSTFDALTMMIKDEKMSKKLNQKIIKQVISSIS